MTRPPPISPLFPPPPLFRSPAEIPAPARRNNNVLPSTLSAQEGHRRGMAAGFEAGFPEHFSRPSIEGSEAAVVPALDADRKSTPLNSSPDQNSHAGFRLEKK